MLAHRHCFSKVKAAQTQGGDSWFANCSIDDGGADDMSCAWMSYGVGSSKVTGR